MSEFADRKCIEKGCDKPAGTKWSPHWCEECNKKRLDRITRNLVKMVRDS